MYNLNNVNPEIISAVEKHSTLSNIPMRFLYALILTESNFNQFAIRHEPNYKWVYSPKEMAAVLKISKEEVVKIQKYSYGVCQIMGAVFHELSFNIMPDEMYNIDVNIGCACKLLGRLKHKYSLTNQMPTQLYDAFNSGKVKEGDNNQKNVDRFNENYLLF